MQPGCLRCPLLHARPHHAMLPADALHAALLICTLFFAPLRDSALRESSTAVLKACGGHQQREEPRSSTPETRGPPAVGFRVQAMRVSARGPCPWEGHPQKCQARLKPPWPSRGNRTRLSGSRLTTGRAEMALGQAHKQSACCYAPPAAQSRLFCIVPLWQPPAGRHGCKR